MERVFENGTRQAPKSLACLLELFLSIIKFSVLFPVPKPVPSGFAARRLNAYTLL
jgi:hypothetical protein